MPNSLKAGSESFCASGFNVRYLVWSKAEASLPTVEIPVMTGQSCKVNIWLSVDMETCAVCIV